MLWQWTRKYRLVYEMYSDDRPEDRIIQDDVAFDRWESRYIHAQALRASKNPKRTDSEVWDLTPKFDPNAQD